MKKVALFSTYCNTAEKQEVLLKNIRKVKELGLDVFVLTLFPLMDEIHKESNFVIHSKENPVPPIEKKSIYSWRDFTDGTRIVSYFHDYGYASLLQLKRLIDFSSVMEYDHYYTMIYDIIITPEIEDVLREGRSCSFFKNPKVKNEMGGILTAFNHENAKKFASLLTEGSYYREGSDIAEAWMLRVNEVMGGILENIYAADSIDFSRDLIDTNHSPFSDFNLFIIKESYTGIFFYNIPSPIPIIIETNLKRMPVLINSNKLVRLSDNSDDIKYIKIIYKGEERNLSKYFDILVRTVIHNYPGDVIYIKR
jgi:hypothetical protein